VSRNAPYDAIVVGAGPAGASAAYWLGEAGASVLVLERCSLPRYKPCGGAVTRGALAALPFDLAPVAEQEIRRVRFRYCDGREVAMDLQNAHVTMVMRDRFDFALLQQTRAEVCEGDEVVALDQDETGVTVSTQSGKAFRARYVVGADGANSIVARRAGLRRHRYLGASMEVEVQVERDLLESYAATALFHFGSPPTGYQWVFPKSTHLSVGIGAFASAGVGMRAALRRTMDGLGISIDGSAAHGHPLPIYVRREPLHSGRVLLAGDAAGLIDPLLGEGIRHALQSGKLTAEAIARDDPASYDVQVRRQIGDDLLWGLRWARLFYRFPRLSYDWGVRNRLFVEEFLGRFAGKTTYGGMAWRAFPNVLRGIGRRLAVV
jgi:geranylgeranyl reductase family protein